MKQKPALVLTAISGGVCGFFLRLYRNSTGYEPGTGLPKDGPFWPLLLLFALAGAALFLLLRSTPKDSMPCRFCTRFATSGDLVPALLITGDFLLAASGVWTVAAALRDSYSDSAAMVSGVLTVLCAAALFFVISGSIRQVDIPPNLLLAPVGYYVIQLILKYRSYSVNPVVEHYYVEILALALLLLTFYKLSAFAFVCAQIRHLALCAAMAVVFCLTALADCPGITSEALFYFAGAVLSLSILLLCRPEGFSPPGRRLSRSVHHEEDSTDV
ncbi:hypothetical protein KQI82_00140 [Oscillibacter sp. MSJ-2]|uniref:Uncharacterized protein n=1 Tax=Dysosmobacter acutus TaxID=2841504 RepID=A0ABS6F4X5_9FIRM|nr:hypothetical protein [Dysosmobacter acutus]MBU5625343.1 hypothetical protein [Dysosmobacter acutus]